MKPTFSNTTLYLILRYLWIFFTHLYNYLLYTLIDSRHFICLLLNSYSFHYIIESINYYQYKFICINNVYTANTYLNLILISIFFFVNILSCAAWSSPFRVDQEHTTSYGIYVITIYPRLKLESL